ncbi:MAG: haloacid dehalogenase type II [Gemmatimonadota bacterium]|nr:haloacid dehalogenase type II [Gemmatimonadota bacterium]
MARVIIIDLNGTLLDLSVLDSPFTDIFGKPDARKRWFGLVQELFLTSSIVGDYKNFEELSDAALEMTATQFGVQLRSPDRDRIHNASAAVPAFGDVASSLALLHDAGFTLITLTNSTAKAARARIERNKLDGYFDNVLSVDAIRCYKPSAASYWYAARELGIMPADCRLVAAHAWDIAGAMKAGCKAAFIARPEQVLNPLQPMPDIIASDLGSVADQIIRNGG